MNHNLTTIQEQATALKRKQQEDLVLYSPKNCNKHSYKIKTIKDVFKLPSKTLGDFKRQYGKEWVIGYISMWLIELNENSSVKNKMTDYQMEFTATRIYETYSLKITDLTLFFRNIKEGVYGQFYESLTQEKIMNWLSEYYDLRCEYAQMHSQGSHEKISLLTEKTNPNVVEKMFEGVGDHVVNFNHETNGLGNRIKTVIDSDLIQKIKSYTTKQLRQYLLTHDFESKTFDENIFNLVEKEIDLRSGNN